MDNIVNNYLKTEQEHLQVLTKSLPNSLLALSDISITTNEIVEKINNTNNNLNLLSSEYEQKILSLIKDKHLTIKEANDSFNENNEKQQKLLSEQIKQLHLALKDKQRENREKVLNIQQEKKDSSKHVQSYFAKHRLVLNNDNKKLEETLEEKRKIYFGKIDDIYQQKVKDINQINNHYNNLLSDYQRVNTKRLRQQVERVNAQQEQKEQYLSFQKNDLIEARQNYYNSLNILNEKINSLQAKYKTLLEENTLFLADKKERTNQQLKHFSNFIYENNQKILNDFEAELKNIDIVTDELKKAFNEEENALTNKHNRAITSINVQLYQQKEKLNNQLSDLESPTKKERKEINKQILKLEKETKIKQKKESQEHYKKLKELTKKHIHEIALQKYQIILKDAQKRNNILQNKRLLSQQENFSFKQNKLYLMQKELIDEIINKSQSLEILPIDVQTTLANYIYTTESQFYHQDQSDIQENFTRQIDIIEKRSLSREIILLRSKERIEINNAAEIKQNELNHYFNMVFEKNKRDYEEEILEQKIKVNKAEYHIQALKGKHRQELFMEKLLHQLEKINTLINIEKEKNNLEIALLKEYNLAKVISEKHKLEKNTTTTTIKNNIENYNLTLNYYTNILTEQKQIVSLLYSQTKKITLSIHSKNKEHLDQELLEHQQKLFKNNIMLVNENIEKTTKTTIELFQNQLNDLTEKKHKNAYETLLNNYNHSKNNITNQISSITNQLNNYMINQANVLNKIHSSKMDNISIIKSISQLTNKLRLLKRNSNSNTVKLTEQDIIIKRKRYNKNKENIKLYQLQIKQINKRIAIFEKQIDSLNKDKQIEDQHKETKEKNLNKLLHKEGKVFYQAIEKINKAKNNLISFNKNIVSAFNNLTTCQLKDHSSFKKQSSKYNKKLIKLQEVIINYFNFLKALIAKNTLFIYQEENELNKINKTFDSLTKKFDKEHKQRIKKINLNLNSLYKYSNSIIKLSGLRLNKAIKVLEEKQGQELSRLTNRKLSQEQNLKTLDNNYNLYVKAFHLNKQQALILESNYSKERLKQAEQQSNVSYKKAQEEISNAQEEINAFNKRRQLQLNYISSVDEDNRKKLLQRQISLNKNYHNELKELIKQKPKINRKIQANRLKSQTKKITIKKASEKKQKAYARVKKLALPFSIRKQQAKAIRSIKKA